MVGFRDVMKVTGCLTISEQQVRAIYCMFLIYAFIQQGQTRMYVLFLSEEQFYWDSVQIGVFIFILYVGAGFKAYPGISILKHVIGDLPIVTLAIICKLLSSVILAFAKDDIPVYLGKYSR